jgi:hypothetical protein
MELAERDACKVDRIFFRLWWIQNCLPFMTVRPEPTRLVDALLFNKQCTLVE